MPRLAQPGHGVAHKFGSSRRAGRRASEAPAPRLADRGAGSTVNGKAGGSNPLGDPGAEQACTGSNPARAGSPICSTRGALSDSNQQRSVKPSESYTLLLTAQPWLSAGPAVRTEQAGRPGAAARSEGGEYAAGPRFEPATFLRTGPLYPLSYQGRGGELPAPSRRFSKPFAAPQAYGLRDRRLEIDGSAPKFHLGAYLLLENGPELRSDDVSPYNQADLN
jgi:hypothetical protein